MNGNAKKAATHWDAKYNEKTPATWHRNNYVSDYIRKRQFGKDGHWLGYVFSEIIKFRPKNVLSVGCGNGEHELAIARNNFADKVIGFDASPVGVNAANKSAKENGLNAEFYVQTFESFVEHPYDCKFDVVMFIGSLHHVENINGVLEKSFSLLEDNGRIIYNEYVGPCYILLPDERISILNRLLAVIPNEFKINPDVKWRNPTMDEIRSTDPSEAIRSALIPQFLRLYFEVEWECCFGGALLHPIFQLLNSNRIDDADLSSEILIKLLIEFEHILEDNKIISSDFVLGIAKKSNI